MRELSADEVITHASLALGDVDTLQAQIWRVERLDHPDRVYYVVVFGDEQAAIAVAAMDAYTGELLSAARLPGVRAHLSIDTRQALQIAGLADTAIAKLVWRPCRASLSPLYPIWQVSSVAGTVFIDQNGGRWDRLSPASA